MTIQYIQVTWPTICDWCLQDIEAGKWSNYNPVTKKFYCTDKCLDAAELGI